VILFLKKAVNYAQILIRIEIAKTTALPIVLQDLNFGNKMNDLQKVCEISDITTKGFYVYKGLPKEKEGKKLLYIGTTIQIPSDRFRWHKANGKDFRFEIIKICKDENEMLDTEFDLIKKYNPKHNKITKRKQNFNRKLSEEEKQLRVGDNNWCQSCLTRRVNKGYKKCYYC
jgi:hypothetical protein